jgi:hypothetical protein
VVFSCFVLCCCSGFFAQPATPIRLARPAAMMVDVAHGRWIEIAMLIVLPEKSQDLNNDEQLS